MLSRWRPSTRPEPDDDFEELYRGHVSDVYRYSLSLVRDPSDAEDVTQTTFLNAYRASGHAAEPAAWLISIARNVCLERYRHAQRRPRVALHEVAATPSPTRRVPRTILSALQGIPARQRTALLLDGLEGRSRAEIAAALDIGETTVTGLLTGPQQPAPPARRGHVVRGATGQRPGSGHGAARAAAGGDRPPAQLRVLLGRTAAPFVVRAVRLASAGARCSRSR